MTHDSIIVKRGKIRGVGVAAAHTTLGGTDLVSAYTSWSDTMSDLDNFSAAVRKLIDMFDTTIQVVAVAKLPTCTLNGAPYAFLLSSPLK